MRRALSRRRIGPVAVGGLIAGLALASVAHAQLPEPPARPTDADVAAARDSFVRGLGHVEARRWDAAVEAFLESYQLSGSPVALLNAGTSLSELGRHRDATEALLRVLHDPGFDEPTRRALERALQSASQHVAILTLHGIPAEGVTWRLDGADRGAVRRQPLSVVLDPGPHRLRILRAEHEPWRWEGRLSAGERIERNVRLEAAVTGAANAGAGEGSDDALVWVTLGLAVAAVVGGVVAAVVIDEEAQLDARSPFVIELP